MNEFDVDAMNIALLFSTVDYDSKKKLDDGWNLIANTANNHGHINDKDFESIAEGTPISKAHLFGMMMDGVHNGVIKGIDGEHSALMAIPLSHCMKDIRG